MVLIWIFKFLFRTKYGFTQIMIKKMHQFHTDCWTGWTISKYLLGLAFEAFSGIVLQTKRTAICFTDHSQLSSRLLSQIPTALRKLYFQFLSHWMGYDRGDSFPFDFKPNGNLFGSLSTGKLSTRSHPIQFERKKNTSFVCEKSVLNKRSHS